MNTTERESELLNLEDVPHDCKRMSTTLVQRVCIPGNDIKKGHVDMKLHEAHGFNDACSQFLPVPNKLCTSPSTCLCEYKRCCKCCVRCCCQLDVNFDTPFFESHIGVVASERCRRLYGDDIDLRRTPSNRCRRVNVVKKGRYVMHLLPKVLIWLVASYLCPGDAAICILWLYFGLDSPRRAYGIVPWIPKQHRIYDDVSEYWTMLKILKTAHPNLDYIGLMPFIPERFFMRHIRHAEHIHPSLIMHGFMPNVYFSLRYKVEDLSICWSSVYVNQYDLYYLHAIQQELRNHTDFNGYHTSIFYNTGVFPDLRYNDAYLMPDRKSEYYHRCVVHCCCTHSPNGQYGMRYARHTCGLTHWWPY